MQRELAAQKIPGLSTSGWLVRRQSITYRNAKPFGFDHANDMKPSRRMGGWKASFFGKRLISA
jgi:hypothetical protein